MPLTPAGRWRELLAGRRILAGAMLGLAFGINSLPFYTSGLLINALHQERGWSLTGLSLGPTLLVAVMALSAPFMGAAFDRFGERQFILPGLIAQAAGFFSLSQIDTLPGYWTAITLMALLGAGCSTPAYLRIVNRTFDASKGTALALTITGAALFSTVVPLLLQTVIDRSGWRAGYAGLGAMVLVAIPAIMLLLPKPIAQARPVVATGSAGDFRYSSLFASPVFVVLAAEIVAVSIACSGLVIHFAPMVTRSGAAGHEAAWLIGIIGMTQMVSRLATGWLIDRYFAPRVAAAIMAVSALGLALLAWGGISWAIVGAVAVGLAYGAEADVVGYFVGRYFPTAHFGRVFGVFYAVSLAATALSPILYGITVDWFGSYTVAVMGAAIMLSLAAILLLRLPDFPPRKDISNA